MVANYHSLLSTQCIYKNAITAIYPNPTNSILNVEFNNNGRDAELKYSILDISGKTIASRKIRMTSGQITFSVPLTEMDLKDGVYFIKLASDNKAAISKFTFIK